MSSLRSFASPFVFANDAATVIPPTPSAGTAYRNTALSEAVTEGGWPYAVKVNSADFNQFLYQVSGVVRQAGMRGIVGWSNVEDYAVGAIQMGSDGTVYKATNTSGPTTTPRDPISEPTYWRPFGGTRATSTEARNLLDTESLITPFLLDDAFKGAANQVLSATGSQRLPGGLIVKWGTTAAFASDSTLAVVFAVAFPNACFGVSATSTNITPGGGYHSIGAGGQTTAGFTASNDGPTGSAVFWIALGY